MFQSAFIVPITTAILLAIPQWTIQHSGIEARLRGVSAANSRVAWASGADNTVLRTADGGATWRKLSVVHQQNDRLEFRDIDAIGPGTAYVLSIGNGPASRIYKTSDAGATWTLQFKNNDPKGFYDAMSFWDAEHGIVIGDAIDGKFYVLTTDNGGRNWVRVPAEALPPALQNEGAFAASGTNIAVMGKRYAWIGTGAAAKARVLRTTDRGRTWKISETPLASGASAGIFSVAFRDAKHGVIVGGDYTKESEARDNLAITDDGGVTWTLVQGLSGFRSAVAYVPSERNGGKVPMLIAVGPSGSDFSIDDGRTWTKLSGSGFDTLSFVPGKSIAWAAGARGSIGRLTWK
ncbi:MAG: hypothetical protein QOJ64_1730 [Acidobacteriota bacterium]|jgi:photosystem II stability/assembly factor-like uncharacterized protein|nr:hypothetical protein [Acidobacteriota bacterium]